MYLDMMFLRDLCDTENYLPVPGQCYRDSYAMAATLHYRSHPLHWRSLEIGYMSHS